MTGMIRKKEERKEIQVRRNENLNVENVKPFTHTTLLTLMGFRHVIMACSFGDLHKS